MMNNKKTTPSVADQQKKKKKVVIAIIVMLVFTLIALTVLTYVDFNQLLSDRKNTKNPHVFYSPDYEADIFQNTEYLEKNRYIKYTDGAVSELIIDGNYGKYGGALEMLGRYIEAIIYGDAAAYASFFSEEFKQSVDMPEKFTMQKLYEIEIAKLSATEDEDAEGEYRQYVYRVSYMIMRNDGTFRKDLGSDALRPQELTIIERNSSMVITNSATYSYS